MGNRCMKQRRINLFMDSHLMGQHSSASPYIEEFCGPQRTQPETLAFQGTLLAEADLVDLVCSLKIATFVIFKHCFGYPLRSFGDS